MSGPKPKARTGVPGLDDILLGGFAAGRLFLLEGSPGTGKTTMALSFLLEGREGWGNAASTSPFPRRSRNCGPAPQSHGWDLDDKIDIFEIVPPESLLDSSQQQSLLYSSDLELGETTKLIFDAVERTKAQRVVVDSLSEIRLLAQELAALSSADPGAEALFRPSRRHRVAS